MAWFWGRSPCTAVNDHLDGLLAENLLAQARASEASRGVVAAADGHIARIEAGRRGIEARMGAPHPSVGASRRAVEDLLERMGERDARLRGPKP